MKVRTSFFCVLLSLSAGLLPVRAEKISFAALREKVSAQPAESIDFHVNGTFARPGTLRQALTVDQDWTLDGRVISAPGNKNLDLAIQRTFRSLSSPDAKTAYMESPDGKYGIRLDFSSSKDVARMPRYSWVRIRLNGCTVYKEGPSYIVGGLSAASIESVQPGTAADIPVKEYRVSQLTDDDIFTQVTLKDCEYVFKDGAYINVYETYTYSMPFNAKQAGANNIMDGWMSLLYDRDANPVYLMLNGRMPWRRDGKGVPQDAGDLSGIVVKTWLPRYGTVSAYALRPLRREDILTENLGKASFKTLAEWNWNDGTGELHNGTGDVAGPDMGKIPAEVGAGSLYTDVRGRVCRYWDTNNPQVVSHATKPSRGGRGLVTNGALQLEADACNWWDWKKDEGRSLFVEVSTKKAKGKILLLAFSFSAGKIHPASSYDYPTYWQVSWSLDGEHYTPVEGETFTLRSLPWWYGAKVKGRLYPTSAEAGMGMTEHMVRLPSELLGKARLYLRIHPAEKTVSTLAYRGQDNGALRPGLKTKTYINFGTVSVRYR